MNGMISQFNLIANTLSGAEQNHRVIAGNIANINTPGYKSRSLDFAEFLQRVQDGTADQMMLNEMPVKLTSGLQVRKDGNNVDLDQQMGEMKKNALMFQTYSHLLASKMSTARRALTS